MILKEAFRYQNYLTAMLSCVYEHLRRKDNIAITTSEHLRSKAQPEAVDETVDNLADREINVKADKIIDLGIVLLREKELLSAAIDSAKAASCPSVDRDISLNRSKQTFISTLRNMSRVKNSERMTYGTAYCFNAEGTQVPYRYDIKEKVEIDFDRNKVKKLIDLLSEECDAASNHADLCITTVEVDFTPRFSITDPFEDLIEGFTEQAA